MGKRKTKGKGRAGTLTSTATTTTTTTTSTYITQTAASAAEPPSIESAERQSASPNPASSSSSSSTNPMPPTTSGHIQPKPPRRFLLEPSLIESLLPRIDSTETEAETATFDHDSDTAPTHTTPKLDFKTFSDLIEDSIRQLCEKDKAWLREQCPDEKLRNKDMCIQVASAIALFNYLTCPPRVLPRKAPSASTSPSQRPPSPIELSIYPSKIIVAIAPPPSPTLSPSATPPRAAPSQKRSTAASSPSHQQTQQLPPPHPYAPLIHALNSPHPSFDLTLSGVMRAHYHFLRASIYSYLPWADERVEEDLGRCLKLDPSKVEAWNMMGEWYCKQQQLRSDESEGKKDYWKLGRTCFEQGLKVKRNRDGLLALAQIIRASPPSKETIQESEKLCKEALLLDPKDGKSWFGLGCTYLKQFFSLTFYLGDLHKSLVAYNHAAADPSMQYDPDLYGNRATIYQYTESYHLALQDFAKCAVCDPFRSSEEVVPKIQELKAMVRAVNATVEGCQRGSSVSSSLSKGPLFPVPFKKVQLVKGGVTDVVVGEDVGFVKREDVHTGKVLVVEVVRCLGDGLPRTFIAKDAKGVCMGLSVFNIVAPIKVGDELAVCSPTAFRIKVDFEDCHVNYINLRIDRPWLLSVNGKVVGKQSIALTEARFETI
ncbi:hypothetical protein BCR33DRAFT_855184 [Rhizoclosmatium globosum]|uniref:Tetratricopeptide repeat protein 5 OB fold domain-containing protein n=1 Tax=Rhizoclosmatium globosum TaxID=329046 RepID=A0A1Y2BNW1_9FUNG|nr:hypothetical protein BCR33DRAFT_855184 [Rhizoclosmatium globosum]|eukprot:ORY36434.1 hypothetical protein BCR33DRAFT_855184 [Rhizoclosmatium globosum]